MIPDDVAARYRAAGAWKDGTLPARFEEVCGRTPDRVAIVEGGTTLTFGEVTDAVARVAGHLARLGVEPGSTVSWQLPNWWEAVVVHHAILRAGAIPNPIGPGLRARDLGTILDEARPALLVVAGSSRGVDLAAQARATGVPVLTVRAGGGDGSLEDLLATGALAPPVPDDAAARALLLYTSGTTAAPKGVEHTHRGLLCELESFDEIHRLTPHDRYLGGAPVTHIAGLAYGILAPFALGTSTVLLERWDPSAALDAIGRHHATFQTGPPTFLQTLAGHPRAADTDVTSFRLFSTGGASIHTASIREAAAVLRCTVKRAYGSTEVPTLTAGTFDDDEAEQLETDGRVIGEAEIRIVRPDGTDAPPGADGEIWARAPEMFVGYRGREDAFEPDGWFRTGDLGRLDERGYLRVTGRIKDVIIRGGENISALEIEEHLAEHPAVAEVAAVGVPDDLLGERVCAIVVPRKGHKIALADLTGFLDAREVAKHKWPERLEVRAELPRNDNGKVLKDELRRSL